MRPKRCRQICVIPDARYFKPRGGAASGLIELVLLIDEYEAIRLADLEGLYHADAAEKMGISRQTFGRILSAAHEKIADAVVNGKALRIEGGEGLGKDADTKEKIDENSTSCPGQPD